MTSNATLRALADEWVRRAKAMEKECKVKPCDHSWGYRQAAYELLQALSPVDGP